MKKICVCGDSFFSCDERWPGTHFSERIAKKLGIELISLARQGISNSGIRLQVDRAISIKPDLVILGSTDSHRFEIPIHSLWRDVAKQSYDIDRGIDNIEYRYYPNPSKNHLDTSKACVWSDHYSKYTTGDFDKEFSNLWKLFFTEIHDGKWKEQQDRWIIESSICALQKNQIPFLYLPNHNWIPTWLDTEFIEDIDLVELANKFPGHTAYHTSQDAQEYIIDRLLIRIQQTVDFT